MPSVEVPPISAEDPGIKITQGDIERDVQRKKAELYSQGKMTAEGKIIPPAPVPSPTLEEQYPLPGTVYDVMGTDPMTAVSQSGGDLRRFGQDYTNTLNDAIASTMARGQQVGNQIQGRYGAIVPGLRQTNAEVSNAYRDALGNLNQGYGALMGDFSGGLGNIANAMAGRMRSYATLGPGVGNALFNAALAPLRQGSNIANVMGQFQNSYQNQLASGLASAAKYGDIAAKGAQLRGAEDASMAEMAAQAQADMLRSQLAQGGLGIAGQIASMNASALPAMLGVQLQAAQMADPLMRMMAYKQMGQNQLATLGTLAPYGVADPKDPKKRGPLQSEFEQAREDYNKSQSITG